MSFRGRLFTLIRWVHVRACNLLLYQSKEVESVLLFEERMCGISLLYILVPIQIFSAKQNSVKWTEAPLSLESYDTKPNLCSVSAHFHYNQSDYFCGLKLPRCGCCHELSITSSCVSVCLSWHSSLSAVTLWTLRTHYYSSPSSRPRGPFMWTQACRFDPL